ncbi:MAG: hypothetical protein ACRDPG_10605 [Nocardioidaceae bacterium]
MSSLSSFSNRCFTMMTRLATGARSHPMGRRGLPFSVALMCLVAGSGQGATAAAEAAPAPAIQRARHVIVTAVTDPDDAEGRLDISRVQGRVARTRSGGPVSIRFEIRTYDTYNAHRLDTRWRHFVIELNADAQAGSERNILVRSNARGRLVAEVISNATRAVIATLHVSRPDPRTIGVWGPRRLIGARSFFASSAFHTHGSPACGSRDGIPITCEDLVPQSGWIRLARLGWP